MTVAEERYEKAWNSFLIYLNHHPKAQLKPFLIERHINHRTMQNWLCEKGYSVYKAKREVLVAQAETRKQKNEAAKADAGEMFLPLQPSFEPAKEVDMLSGINVTFPNGTVVTIKKGSAKSVMQLMKLYEKEDLLCLD